MNVNSRATSRSAPFEQTLPGYLQGFSQSQLDIILSQEPIKQVIAGAGSGKTRTVVGVVEHALNQPDNKNARILLLSFSRKAAGEIKERISEKYHKQVEISTFHSFCYRHLSALHPAFQNGSLQILEDEKKDELLASFFKDYGDVIGGIPYSLILRRRDYFESVFPELLVQLDQFLWDTKKKNNLLEYEDLIDMLLRDLKEKKQYLDALRASYQLIIVDEFQDTDYKQLDFLKQMNSPQLLVVGDDWQAIYSFRGATVQPFLDFPLMFPGAKQFRLGDNYRSLEPIVRLGKRVIRKSSKQLKKKVLSMRKETEHKPVLAVEVEPESEHRFVEMLLTLKLEMQEIRILCRTNFQVSRWVRAGFPEEMVMTIHKSKGLEFETVFLDLTGGWSRKGEESEGGRFIDEELRILYVGLTRAKDNLVVMHSEPLESESEAKLERRYFEGLIRGASRQVSTKALIRILNQRWNRV